MADFLMQFAKESPFLFFFCFWIAAWAVTTPITYGFRAYNRHLRSKNIAAHGWPTAPIDADGDVVYPDEDEQAEAR